MRKWLLVIIGTVVLVCGFVTGCVIAPSTTDSLNEHYISRTIGKAYHPERGCKGHAIIVEKHVFEEDGHEMWLWVTCLQNTDYRSINIMDSPNCKLCHPKTETVVEEPVTTSSYWGW
ncbi:MAG: hypothetical protein J6U54_15165 [Clostridiales bacterium]|nr:hypothetical protein [Clostridiales bacterium]